MSETTGFSALASDYDASAVSNPVVVWLRDRIRRIVVAEVPPGGHILEINAGSGVDAAYLATRGFHVHATDVAPGMLAAISEKAADPLLVGSLSLEERSFDDLGGVDGAPYDLVFSNLGGLNCTDDIDAVAEGMQRVLKPRGAVVLVLMPPVCPWEVAQVLRGHVRFATRRWSRDPVMANVGGEQQPVWYHTPGRVRRALGPAFEVTALRSFCLLAPPSYFEGFADRHPRLFRSLSRLDNLIGGTWPLNRAGDFYALVARYRG